MNELYRDDVQETAIFADAAFLVFGIVFLVVAKCV